MYGLAYVLFKPSDAASLEQTLRESLAPYQRERSNPLGRWDWWDLGGRFNCAILGQRGEHLVVEEGLINSGPSRGREVMGLLADALGAEASDVDALVEANVEPVEALLDAVRKRRKHAFPSVLVLPVGAIEDASRWIEPPPPWAPEEGRLPIPAKAFLGLPDNAAFKPMCLAAYQRFADHAAAGVAYHF